MAVLPSCWPCVLFSTRLSRGLLSSPKAKGLHFPWAGDTAVLRVAAKQIGAAWTARVDTGQGLARTDTKVRGCLQARC